MASIYKRGKVWWIHYHVAGKSICRSLNTTKQRVAEDKKKRLEGLQGVRHMIFMCLKHSSLLSRIPVTIQTGGALADMQNSYSLSQPSHSGTASGVGFAK